ncbi:penicillin-binding protein activator LpoB [Paludibacterium paludis]|uniref:Penicillin-binding protein activator LpoB n=1 Tax=Paludibacterium paludis TaxID=1225769 RepID=A0A918P693_9NEIS|nr:penicillin-binding protein activator LpoB [Paludibacterium paludis]GGY25333.1 penicillin-binding protein activator LpoB [Paludibacterium paludis]
MSRFVSFSRVAAVSLIAAALTGCASTNSPLIGGNKVSYGDSKGVELVTNEFGSTDLQKLAESMARSLTQVPTIRGKRLTLSEVQNKTSEYIDTVEITKSIRVQLMKSGTVRFVADTADMHTQTQEIMRQTQSGMYDKSKSKKIGKMVGADYRLVGGISSIVKKNSDIKDVYYKLSLELIDNETGELAWADEQEIRKTSRR